MLVLEERLLLSGVFVRALFLSPTPSLVEEFYALDI
jgi:hypothetical protein